MNIWGGTSTSAATAWISYFEVKFVHSQHFDDVFIYQLLFGYDYGKNNKKHDFWVLLYCKYVKGMFPFVQWSSRTIFAGTFFMFCYPSGLKHLRPKLHSTGFYFIFLSFKATLTDAPLSAGCGAPRCLRHVQVCKVAAVLCETACWAQLGCCVYTEHASSPWISPPGESFLVLPNAIWRPVENH